MRTEMIETTTGKRNGHMGGMLHGRHPKQVTLLKNSEYMADPALQLGAFFGRPTWITTGATAYLDNRGYMADSALRMSRDADRYDAYAAFMSRPTWITTGMFKGKVHLDNRAYMVDLAVKMGAFFSRRTWITTGAVMPVDNREYMAELAIRRGKDMTDTGQSYAAFLSKPTWIVTGVYEHTRIEEVSVQATKGYANRTQDYPDDESLRFVTAVLALKMALAGFTGDQRVYPRI
jgi:hypothetical protein